MLLPNIEIVIAILRLLSKLQSCKQDFFARGANELRAIYLNMRQLLSCPIYLK